MRNKAKFLSLRLPIVTRSQLSMCLKGPKSNRYEVEALAKKIIQFFKSILTNI